MDYEVNRLSNDAKRLATHFSRHSITEKIGADTIDAVARGYCKGMLQACLLDHAVDEHKHCRIFSNISARLDKLIVLDEQYRRREQEENKAFLASFDGNIVRFVCDTHVAEIRNLCFLQRYVSAFSTNDVYVEIGIPSAIQVILDDEHRHVGYTGRIIDAWHEQGRQVTRYLSAACELYDASLMQDLTKEG